MTSQVDCRLPCCKDGLCGDRTITCMQCGVTTHTLVIAAYLDYSCNIALTTDDHDIPFDVIFCSEICKDIYMNVYKGKVKSISGGVS